MLPAFIVIFLVIIYPLIDAAATSFFRYFLTDARGKEFIGFDNYAYMLSSSEFWKSFLNTVIYVGGTVLGEFILGFALALLVNFQYRGKNTVNTLFFVSWIIPSVVVALITKYLFFDHYNGIVNVVLKELGLIKDYVPWLKSTSLAMPTLIIATVWKMFPFMFVLMYAGLQSIPIEEIEASKIDGAGVWARFFRITLPNMQDIIALATILEFIWQFQYMTVIWTTTKGGPVDATATLPVLVYRMSFKGSMNMGYASTIGVFWLVFLLLFSIVYIRMVSRKEED